MLDGKSPKNLYICFSTWNLVPIKHAGGKIFRLTMNASTKSAGESNKCIPQYVD